MTAAVITATTVQLMDEPSNLVSGSTPRRLKKFIIEGPKAAQNDWFLLSSYLTAAECINIFKIYAIADGEAGSANVPVLDTFSYTSADKKLIFSGAVTGIARAEVTYWNE